MIYNDRKCQHDEAARGHDDGDVRGAVRPFVANFPLVINISSRLSGRRRFICLTGDKRQYYYNNIMDLRQQQYEKIHFLALMKP